MNKNLEQLVGRFRRNFGKPKVPEIFSRISWRENLWSSLPFIFSPMMQHFCLNIGNAPALDDVYNVNGSFFFGRKKLWPLEVKPDRIGRMFLNSPNGVGVRNRYEIVRKFMEQEGKKGRRKFLSIACGSAQPIIHATYNLLQEGITTELTLTDESSRALGMARKRASQAGILGQVKFIQAPFQKLAEIDGHKFDVVESCGIIDYLSDRATKRLLKVIRQFVTTDGIIIVSNMQETMWARDLRRVYNWEIRYRIANDFHALIQNAGWQHVKVQVENEGIYTIATAEP